MQSFAIFFFTVVLKSLNHFSAKTPSLDGDCFSYRDPRFGLVFVAARSTHISACGSDLVASDSRTHAEGSHRD